MNPKPKLGLIALAKKNHFKGEINELVDFFKVKLAQESSIDHMIVAQSLFDEAEIVAAARDMEKQECDLIVFVVGTWIYSSIAIAAINDLHTPFILWGLSDRIANGNLGASVQIRYVLQEMGKKFPYICGRIRDEKNYGFIMKFLRSAWVKKSLRNRKIATIGGKCMMMYQTQVNEFSWKSVFGVDFPQYDTAQVFTEMEGISDVDAQKVADTFLEKIDKINWTAGNDTLEKDAVLTQAKMYLAFKRLKKLYNVDVFANKCMPEMMHVKYGYGYGGCIATCMLNEEGIITACEADVPAGLSMYILRLFTGKPVFFADIARVNKPQNKLTFFNCGTAPVSMADRKKGVQIWPIAGNIADEAVPDEYFIGKMKGGCISFELECGKPVTMFRIGGNDGTLRFHAVRATTCAREIEGAEDVGNRWPGFGLTFRQPIDDILVNTVGHHYSISFGDWTEELKYLAQILGIGYVENE